MQNVAIEYDYYTLEQAREIIKEENRQKAIKRAKRKMQRKAETIYYIKQKLIGLAVVGLSVANPLLLDGDATISVLMLPLGIFLMATKEKVMMF